MSGEGYPQSPAPTEAEVREVVNRILSSKYFSNAPTKQRFLQLICEAYINGREDQLNEYMIGCEVYGRDETYNPALDPIVRVGAHGLRKKLQSYYKAEGRDDELILEIPVGSYIPTFTRRARPPEPIASTNDTTSAVLSPESGEQNERSEESRRRWITLLSLVIALLIMAVLVMAFSTRQLCGQFGAGALSGASLSVIKPVWETFFKDENPTLIVLTNPPVFRLSNPDDPAQISRFSTDLTRAETDAINEIFGRERLYTSNGSTPRLVLSRDEYSSFGETIGLYQITQLFNKIGKNVVLKQSRRLTVEDLKDHNAILLGTGWINEWAGNTPIRKSLSQGPSANIIKQNLLSEEDGSASGIRRYRAKFDKETGLLIEDYATIIVKPGISERKTIMVLAGSRCEGTQAAAEYLTDEHHLANLNRLLVRSYGTIPKYFKALLKVHVDSGVTTKIEIIKISELKDSR